MLHHPRRRGVAASLAATLGILPACAPRRAPAPPPTPAANAAAARDTSSVAIGNGKTVERLFTGRFPGVDVSAGEGGGLRIRIRGGQNSFMGGSEPLYIIDGTPVEAGRGGLVFLNPYDIERIEVLKNPADTGIYGVRGANGVIRITTTRPGRR